MVFYLLNSKKPINGQRCVIKEKVKGVKGLSVFLQPQFYYDDCGFMSHPSVVSWAPVPDHVEKDRSEWKSEYFGDELPEKNCECLICRDDSKVVKYAYFSKEKNKFLGQENVIAFIEI